MGSIRLTKERQAKKKPRSSGDISVRFLIHSTRHANREFSRSSGDKVHENISTVHKILASFYLHGPYMTARNLDTKPLKR